MKPDVSATIVLNAMARMHKGRWLAGEFWAADGDGVPWCFVTAERFGEMVQGDGATREEAWLCAIERAQAQSQTSSRTASPSRRLP